MHTKASREPQTWADRADLGSGTGSCACRADQVSVCGQHACIACGSLAKKYTTVWELLC